MVQLLYFKKHFSLNEIDAIELAEFQMRDHKQSQNPQIDLWLFDTSDPFYKDKENSFKIRKKVISHYLNLNPTEVFFVQNENGKPQIRDDINPMGLKFNVSHSHDLLGIAISRVPLLGLDIELVRPITYQEKIVKKYFTEAEKNNVKSHKDFFRFWTAKEAAVKSIGGSFFKDVANLNLNCSHYPKIQFKDRDIFYFEHVLDSTDQNSSKNEFLIAIAAV